MSPATALAEVRQYKLARAKEIRNTCPYCSVGCGLLMYSLGDGAKNAKQEIIHIEGDPDHPVSRGSLCPKGAGLLDFIHSPNRLKYPEVREAGSSEWKRISWHEAIERIAKHMKADRDANFIAKNADGVTVNRWLSTAMLTASASSNETGIITRSSCVPWHRRYRRPGPVCHGPHRGRPGRTFGRGAMTNTWVDIKNADFILIMAATPPRRTRWAFKWAIERKKKGAKLIVVDRASTAPPRGRRVRAHPGRLRHRFPGRHHQLLVANDKIQWITSRPSPTPASSSMKASPSRTACSPATTRPRASTTRATWSYELDARGQAKSDPSLEHPRCVWNLMKAHYARYTRRW